MVTTLKDVITVSLLVMLSLIATSILSMSIQVVNAETLDGPKTKDIHVTYEYLNNWWAVQGYGHTSGEKRKDAQSAYVTVIQHASLTFGINYAYPKSFSTNTYPYYVVYYPETANHEVKIEIPSYLPPPSPAYIQIVHAYDNMHTGDSPPASVTYSLNVLRSFINSIAHLPIFPDPWNVEEFSVTQPSDTKVYIHYNTDPSLQSASWYIYVSSEDGGIKEGWYFVDTYSYFDVYVKRVSYGYYYIYVGHYSIFLTADFYVDRLDQ